MSITEKEYAEEITALAESINNDYDIESMDISDIIHELIEGHEWIIYTYKTNCIYCNMINIDFQSYILIKNEYDDKCNICDRGMTLQEKAKTAIVLLYLCADI